MVTVTEIAYTGYPVTDLPRARAFYEGVLNLKPGVVFEAKGALWIEYDIGPTTLAFADMSTEWRPSASGPAAALELENFDEAIAALRAAGNTFLIEHPEGPIGWLAVVLDPAGTSLALHRRKAG